MDNSPSHLEREKTLQIRGKTFREFVPLPVSILRSNQISDGAKLLFADLLSYAWFNAECFPGQDKLAQDLGVSPRWIRKLLTELEKIKLISCKQRGLSKTNIYTINDIPDKLLKSEPDRNNSSAPDRNATSYKVDEEEVDEVNKYKRRISDEITPGNSSKTGKKEKALTFTQLCKQYEVNTGVGTTIIYYLNKYRDSTLSAHPPLKLDQWSRIIEAISTFEGGISSSTWEGMINVWFDNPPIETDFNLNVFMSETLLSNLYYTVRDIEPEAVWTLNSKKQ